MNLHIDGTIDRRTGEEGRQSPCPLCSLKHNHRRFRGAAEAEGKGSVRVLFEPDKSRLHDRLLELARAGDIIITLGAGDITRVGRELIQWLRAA